MPETQLTRFVRGLLGGGSAVRRGAAFVQDDGRRAKAKDVAALITAGALAGDERQCRANPEARSWLKRAMLAQDAFQAQHRITVAVGGREVNVAESALARLAAGKSAFLAPHQLEAGERVRRIVERAQLRSKLTMSYSDAHTARGRPGARGDISDLAVDARRALDELYAVLPCDCAGVVVDVCGFLKGLQDVERERNWPRRSAKLVLRIGLEHLAQHFGLDRHAVGRPNDRRRDWMDAGARAERFE